MPHFLRGIVLKIGATFAFSVMYALIKLAGAVPVGEVIFFRAVFALIPLFVLSLYTVGPLAVIRTARPFWHITRSVAGVSSMFLTFAAVKFLRVILCTSQRAGRGVTSASTRRRAHLMASTYIFCISGWSQLASTWPSVE